MGIGSRTGAIAPSDVPRVVGMIHVPTDGTLTVRFLDGYDGIQTHFVGKRSFHCGGVAECLPARHKGPCFWKGYAPVEYWLEAPEGLWVPAVLEITERLDELLYGRNLQREQWRLARVIGDSKWKEVSGEFLGRDDWKIRDQINVDAIVRRVLRSEKLRWGQRPSVPAREYLPPTVAPPPLGTVDPHEQAGKPMSRQEVRERLQAQGWKPRSVEEGVKS